MAGVEGEQLIAASLTLQIVFVEKRVKACTCTIYIHLSLEFNVMSDGGTSTDRAVTPSCQEK